MTKYRSGPNGASAERATTGPCPGKDDNSNNTLIIFYLIINQVKD